MDRELSIYIEKTRKNLNAQRALSQPQFLVSMWIIYVIQNSGTKELYFGFTSNLKRRLEEHNFGRNISTKRSTRKWIVIYAEAYCSKRDAMIRENRLKRHGSGKHELLKRLFNSRL
jgi:putative endonuclease